MENAPMWVSIVIVPLVLWAIFWKAVALWHSARNGDAIWFVVFLVISTAGLLEILYLSKSGKLKKGKLLSR